MKYFFCTILLFILLPSIVSAAEINIGIYPPIIEVTTEPGSVIKETITVYSEAGDLITMDASYFIPEGEEGKILLKQNNPYFVLPEFCTVNSPSKSLSSEDKEKCEKLLYSNSPTRWLEFSEKSFILLKTSSNNTSTSKQIDLQFRVPKDTPEGDYYITVFATNHGKAEGVVEGYTQHEAKIGSNILITVKSEENSLETKAEIVEFSIPLIVTQTPFQFNAKVKNTGNTRFKTYKNVEILNLFGSQVASSNLLPVNILKNSTRVLQTNLEPSSLVIDPTQSKHVLGAATVKLLPSIYKAQLNILPNNIGEAPLIAEAYFLYFPIEFVFVLFILVGAVFAIKYSKSKNKYNSD